jgi:N-acetylneuraminate synthase/N,N'-diacetyllegionaminate synthase
LYPIKDLPKGTILKDIDLIALRPNNGIDARDYQKVIGKTLIKEVKKHEKLDYKILK